MEKQDGVTPGSQPAENIVEDFGASVLAAAGISEEPVPAEGEAPAAKPEDDAAPKPADPKPEAQAQDGQANAGNEDPAQPTEFKSPNAIPKERFDEVNSRLKRSEESRHATEQKLKAREGELSALKSRLSNLSPEEKEDYDYQRKIGAANEESRLADSIETLKDQLASKDAELNSAKSEVESLKNQESEAIKTAFVSRLDELEKKFDGSNGLPKFSRDEILAYGQAEGIYPKDPYKLYAMKYAGDLAAARLSRKKPDAAPASGIKSDASPVPPKDKASEPGSEEYKRDVLSALYAAN